MIKRITEEAIAMLMQNGIKDKKQIETLRDVLLITLSKYEIKEKETSKWERNIGNDPKTGAPIIIKIGIIIRLTTISRFNCI